MITLQNFTPPDLQVINKKQNLYHIFTEEDCAALWAAWAAGRPLLVRGKPGTGKSQMAKAIAEQLGWAFVAEVIRGDTELSDLHYYFDAVARLGEAQAQAGVGSDKESLKPEKFLSPGALWWAYSWKSAEKQYNECVTKMRPMPFAPKKWESAAGGVVLLIDEIDKADPNLPNGLLESLGNLQFTVPYLEHRQSKEEELVRNPIEADPPRLLVVITTNEERELPPAFVRRCFVHTLKMEKSKEVVETIPLGKKEEEITKREQWLIERGKLHFDSEITESVYLRTAKLLWDDRDEISYNRYPPGLAEYIDLLGAIRKVDKGMQAERLEAIAGYAMKKELQE